MRDLSFDVELTWSGAGHEGAGRIQSDDVALDLSGPESMGGRGVGTNPEELFVCAVSSCYTATLFAVLRRAQVPIESLTVTAHGTVTGFPAATRFTRIVVTPTVIGATSPVSPGTRPRPLWRTIAPSSAIRSPPEVAYEVGSVHAQGDLSPVPTADEPLRGSQDAGDRPSSSRAT